jgi:hypothetical protein
VTRVLQNSHDVEPQFREFSAKMTFFSSLKSRLTQTKRASLVLVAPAGAVLPHHLENVQYDSYCHEGLVASMQCLRGASYLQDGAIQADALSSDGRHRLAIDSESWHLLSVNADGVVQGCIRYRNLPHNVNFEDLWVRNSELARSEDTRHRFRGAVESELERARHRGISYAEVGGWAISAEFRMSAEALRTALATYALARVLGGSLGITTATARHCSSTILRKIGGSSLQWDGAALAPYYDPQYSCEMEVLRFDSEHPSQRYAECVDELTREIVSIPVVCRNKVDIRPAPVSSCNYTLRIPDQIPMPCVA